MSLLTAHFRGRIFPVAMMYFDLHCDSVTKAYKEKISLFDDSLDVKIKCDKFNKREQCFALWLGDELQGEAAFSYCKKLLSFYEENKDMISVCGVTPHLTIENAAALGGDLKNIAYFKEKGVIMMSLTWNGENDLGFGADFSGGLKPFGKEFIREMERNSLIIDVSHLNERGFYDLCSIATKPFAATHSCCYDICRHRRNLKLWQIKEIIEAGGLIGINFYPAFLGTDKVSAFEKIRENIELIASLGGENNIAIGSDFDGAKMSKELPSSDFVPKLYDYLLSCGISREMLNKVFYGNANRFIKSFGG